MSSGSEGELGGCCYDRLVKLGTGNLRTVSLKLKGRLTFVTESQAALKAINQVVRARAERKT